MTDATEKPGSWKKALQDGQVIPALPLALHEDRSWSERHQRALIRYYLEAGAGGLAVAVHSTQFAIRDPRHGLLEPVLALAAEEMDVHADPGLVRVAGILGNTEQAVSEAEQAAGLGYHLGLVGMTAFRDRTEEEGLEHLQRVSEVMPVMGFYLQPAVGGRVFSREFWKRACEISGLLAIKVAPFNRYQTLDVVQAVVDSGRDEVALYTGNDDHILGDLLTPFPDGSGGDRFMAGGLLGQWGVWTRTAVSWFQELKRDRAAGRVGLEWLRRNAILTEANAAVFDSAKGFSGCIPGILEVLRRQGLVPSRACLNPAEDLSPGQAGALDRVQRLYPELMDDDFVAARLDAWLK